MRLKTSAKRPDPDVSMRARPGAKREKYGFKNDVISETSKNSQNSSETIRNILGGVYGLEESASHPLVVANDECLRFFCEAVFYYCKSIDFEARSRSGRGLR